MSATLEDRIRAYAATLDAATPRPSGLPAPADRELVELAGAVPTDASRRDRRLVAVAAIAVVAILAGAVAALTLGGGHDSNRVSTVTSAPHPTSTSVAPTTTTLPTTTTTAAAPTEADALAPFFNGAAELDRRLKVAASDVNADLGPTTAKFRASTVAAVRATTPSPLAKTIPPGLPPTLERAVLVVFSELVSRYDSMSTCVGPGSWSRAELAQLDCFVHGAPAAARFPADLAAARAQAGGVPPITPVAPSSRTVAELQLQILVIYENNGGCAATGGFIVSELAPIVWQASSTLPEGPRDGTAARMPFQASYAPSSGWTTRLLVC